MAKDEGTYDAAIAAFERFDQAKRAEQILDHVLRDEELDKDTLYQLRRRVGVDEARHARPIIDPDTGRTTSRVLFVTNKERVLEERSELQREYRELAAYFDEVHVLALIPRRGEVSTTRIAQNAWVYRVHARHWWWLPIAARSTAHDILSFNGVPRPDFVVATEPYESGVAAWLIARAFVRPLQIHVPENFTTDYFKEKRPENVWRQRFARFVLARTKSVRVHTEELKTLVAQRFKNVADLGIIPKFYNFNAFMRDEPVRDIHETYTDYSFIILARGELSADSSLHTVFTALYQLLQNPRIGLVLYGDGPARSLFEEKANILGVSENVAFVGREVDLFSYVKSADLLIEAATDMKSEEHILQAAAAGLPAVMAETELRCDLFEEGRSGFLCKADDPACFTKKVNRYLNSPALHHQFSRAVRAIARDRLIEDPDRYYRAYRDSIEVILETYEPEERVKDETNPYARTVEDGMSYPSDLFYSDDVTTEETTAHTAAARAER